MKHFIKILFVVLLAVASTQITPNDLPYEAFSPHEVLNYDLPYEA